MSDYHTNPYRLGRRPGKQGLRPLSSDQGRIDKLTTGKHTIDNTTKIKPGKNILTVDTWNMQTLWAAGKLELLRNEMKRFRYDIIGISEVRWTGKGETSRKDFLIVFLLNFIEEIQITDLTEKIKFDVSSSFSSTFRPIIRSSSGHKRKRRTKEER